MKEANRPACLPGFINVIWERRRSYDGSS
jgi:hypothetical protein